VGRHHGEGAGGRARKAATLAPIATLLSVVAIADRNESRYAPEETAMDLKSK
jgi:hypothetical protein